MGIIARDDINGNVYHARNLDTEKFISDLQYLANFTKNGKTVFIGSQVAAFAGVFTGFKNGAFSLEINTRYPSEVGGNAEMFDNLFEKKTLLDLW